MIERKVIHGFSHKEVSSEEFDSILEFLREEGHKGIKIAQLVPAVEMAIRKTLRPENNLEECLRGFEERLNISGQSLD